MNPTLSLQSPTLSVSFIHIRDFSFCLFPPMLQFYLYQEAAMATWLSYLALTTKVLYSNLGQLTNGCWSQITRTMHTSALVASQYVRGALRQTGLLSRATASNSCRENIRLSQLCQDSIHTARQPKGGVFLLSFSTMITKLYDSISYIYISRANHIGDNSRPLSFLRFNQLSTT